MIYKKKKQLVLTDLNLFEYLFETAATWNDQAKTETNPPFLVFVRSAENHVNANKTAPRA